MRNEQHYGNSRWLACTSTLTSISTNHSLDLTKLTMPMILTVQRVPTNHMITQSKEVCQDQLYKEYQSML